jgi:hypothetical protein
LAAGDEQLLQRVERAELPVLYVKCWRGPKFAGPTYADDVTDFERTARRVGVQHLAEGRSNFDSVLNAWKQRIPKSSPKKS